MGTLTADVPRLAEHCPHKLATSCRLTSTPNCCACADERPHSTSYSVYIDGVGFVRRGTRWQSYCWFCKEFWNNRIAATDPPLPLSQTRIPHSPDQSEFLERWTEFHQGYRIIRAPNGNEMHLPVVGEPFRDVSPGFLPRTLYELRTGQQNDLTRASNRTTRPVTSIETARLAVPHRTIEEELDNLLLEEDTVEEQTSSSPNPQLQSDESQRQLRERRAERRSIEHMRRVWGTREDIESDEYTSPIANMFTRTTEWHRRQMERLRAGQEAARSSDEVNQTSAGLPELQERLFPINAEEARRLGLLGFYSRRTTMTGDFRREEDPLIAGVQQISHLDNDDRPAPKTDAEKMIKLECQICYQQVADIACVPCGHLVMCEWCANIQMPVIHGNIPARPSQCPMCRKKVTTRLKIHVG